jgi:hypothetical protein
MRPDLLEMTERVARLRDDAVIGDACPQLLARIEDALSEGYGLALTGDAWSIRNEERLHEIISDTNTPVRGRALRTIATEHARFERDLIGLRRALAELRRDRDRLCARSHSAPA